ncbi:Aspartyl protease [Saccharomyces pastorianus]|uniref:Aspartyl protease n=1 Tax=Saccharomyces pastorianus TaxID=27292 RepID=A0A6C1EC56_SACPS|nr:Aspartyl protease [Saccharomyces pastorianus]
MRLATIRSALLPSLFASQALAKIIPVADNRDDGDDTGSKYVKLSFDKLYGDSLENAGSDKTLEVRLLKRDDGYEEIIITNQKSFYSVELEVGTPAQNITVLVDTGSSDLWIMGSSNPYCSSSSGGLLDGINPFGWLTETGSATATGSAGGSGGGSGGGGGGSTGGGGGGGFATATQSVPASEATMDCKEYGTFTTSDSSTFKSNNSDFEISYGDGTFASGVFGTDVLNLSDLNVTGLSFAVANKTNSSMGVLGIGLPALEVTYSGSSASTGGKSYKYDNFPIVLKNSGAIKSNSYSLYLNDLDAKHGTILFGGVDHNKYSGTLYTVPLVNTLRGFSSPIQFEVTLNGLGTLESNGDEKTLTTTKIPALLDSGTTLTYLPEEMVDLIAEEVGAQYSSRVGYYVMKCPSSNNSTQIVFDFGGFHINAALSSFILSTTGSTCILGILPTGDSSSILGDSFLTNAYVVYDLDNLEVSMAQAKYNVTSEDIDIISTSVPNVVKAPGYTNTWSTSASIVTGGNIFTIDSSATASYSGNVTSSTASATSTTSSKRNGGDRTVPSLLFTLISLISAFI